MCAFGVTDLSNIRPLLNFTRACVKDKDVNTMHHISINWVLGKSALVGNSIFIYNAYYI